jgi:hypothetical protein
VSAGAQRAALVAAFAAIPLATGALIGRLEGSGRSFTLFIAPEIWLGSTIAVAAAVARSRSAYGRFVSMLGAVGAAVGYGLVVFPVCSFLGYWAASGRGVG